jgi:hypothetical protein
MPALIQLNLSTGEWSMPVAEPEPFYSTVEIGFVSGNDTTEFDNLKFGFVSKVDGKKSLTKEYPEEGISYISTDQEYISADMIKAAPDSVIFINVWAENAGERYEGSFDVVVPRPEAPFPSWIWNAEAGGYSPPITKPTEPSPTGNGYMWDEETTSWVPRPAEPEDTPEELPEPSETDE